MPELPPVEERDCSGQARLLRAMAEPLLQDEGPWVHLSADVLSWVGQAYKRLRAPRPPVSLGHRCDPAASKTLDLASALSCL